MGDGLGDRMKANYENRQRHYLTRRMPVIVRVDGRAFHTFTRHCERPFDEQIVSTMTDAAIGLAEEMQGCKLAYIQSDEASFLLTDFDTLQTGAWFDYVQSKVESISASVFTARFNALYDHPTTDRAEAHFDARAFNVPREEVANYFLWRAKDWERNSISMYCGSFFSHKSMHGQGIIQERNRRWTDESMLARLTSLIKMYGKLSAAVIDAAENVPTSSAYRSRFGSLLKAYRLAGFNPGRDYSYIEINRELRKLHPRLLDDLVRRLGTVGADVTHNPATGLLEINRRYSASLALSRCRQTNAGSLRWTVRFDEPIAPDITILVRMDTQNQQPADYYLFPIMDIVAPRLVLRESNKAYLDTFQFEDLAFFIKLATRRRIEVAA